MAMAQKDTPATRRRQPLQLDGPTQEKARPGLHAARIVKVDFALDLALIEHHNGPFYCVPVAPPGHRPSAHLLSVGYDEMRWPVTERTATLLYSHRDTTWTREPPWHGRSGGALFDVDAGLLIGVNTAIYSPSGSSAGIGFAIPVDDVNRVVPEIIRHGKVVRPGLGIVPAPDQVARQVGVTEGVLVVRVTPNSAAAGVGPDPRRSRLD